MSSNIFNRPHAYLNTNYEVIPDSMLDESFRADYQGGANMIYKGFARPGASESEAIWQIAKLSYDGNDNVLTIKWPLTTVGVSSNDYQFVWADRTTYTYT